MKFSIDLPVQFRDIDVMGHVNNATYLQYMETARVELARSLGQVREGSRIGDRSWDLDYSIHGPRKAEYAIGRTTQVAYDYKARSAAKISGKLKRELAKYVGLPLKFRETG